MKKQWISLTGIFMFLLLVSWMNGQKPEDYHALWTKVQQFSKKDLPKSALKIVDKIYTKAKADGNESEIVKTLIYRIGLQSTFQEDFRLKSIHLFEKERQAATPVENRLLSSLLGQLYQGYFDEHFNEILSRKTSAIAGDTTLETLNATQWNRKISQAYLFSVSTPKILEQIPLHDFYTILQADSSAFKLWPTLYDLLAHRAIRYFSTEDRHLTFAHKTLAADTGWLIPSHQFVQIDFSRDSATATGKVLQLFQHLLRLHEANHQPEALVDVDLQRLHFVSHLLSRKLVNEQAYAHALERLLQKYENQKISVRIAVELARTYQSLAVYHLPTPNYLVKAETTCKKVLKAFPQSPFNNNCKNILTAINKPGFNLKIQQALLPDKPFPALITYKNTSKIYFKVTAFSPDIEHPLSYDDTRALMRQVLQKKPVKTGSQALPFAADHLQHTAEIALPELPLGSYVVFISNDPRFSKESTVLFQQFQVTRLTVISQKNNAAHSLDVYVLDRENGASVQGAVVHVFGRKYNYQYREQRILSLGKFTTDANGFVQIPITKNEFNGFILNVAKKNDTTDINTFAHFSGELYHEKPHLQTFLFTDRAIYRPGQTVYFKGVTVEIKGNNAHVKAGVKQDVQLLDTHYKTIDVLHLVSNASGSVSGSFVLPDVVLNGRFMIKTATGMVSIRVENYKRPVFHVIFDTLKKAYALNDVVSLSGKVAYYFGGHADSLPVKYTVKRESYFPFPVYYENGYPGQPNNVEIAGGTVHTDSNGHFQITFKALANENIPENSYPVYRFVIQVQVTDASGEMHVAKQDIRLSRLALLIKLPVPQKVNREQSHGIKIITQNLMGAKVPADVQLKLYKLTPRKTFLLKPLWPKPDTILIAKDYFEQNFPHLAYRQKGDKNIRKQNPVITEEIRTTGDTNVLIKKLKKLKPGKYLLVATAKNQPEVPVRKTFILTSEHATKLPVKEIFWHNLSAYHAEPGDVLQLRVGSSAGNMRMFFEIRNGREVVQRQWLLPGKKLLNLQIPVNDSFRGNFVVRLLAVHSNRFFSWSQVVKVPFTNKKLSVSLQTNRNFLKPGEKEQWKIQIKSASGKLQPAFLLAEMYDASLDVYASNQWKMFPYHSKTVAAPWRSYLFNTGYNRILYRKPFKTLPETRPSYPKVNWFGYPLMAGEVLKAMPVMTATIESEGKTMTNKTKPAQIVSSVPQVKKEESPVPLRTNFNETAFFYPNLTTDSSGNAQMNFVTPDALTQWKFRVLAYTKDMKTGTFVRKFIARKDLMVVPNLPRFVRQGDRLAFSARLSNLSDKTLPVKVNIEFFNPENGKTLNLFLTRKAVEQQVKIASGKNALVSWFIHIPQNIHLLAYRIKAVSGDVSDGEERMIPVLTNRQLITESMPMFVNGNHRKTFVFNHFLKDTSASRRDFRYTLTFTSHPVWYAVQALPYLSKPEYESAENLFYRYYAYALAGKILKTYPRIHQVFQQWKQHSPEALMSALQKDTELKNIVLQATPWVLEAQNETEQKRRIALLFDLNQMQHKRQSALNRLQSVQQPSGAWSWFPGMPADIFTTENILAGMADLNQMKAIDMNQLPALKTMLQKGLHFLDNEMMLKYNRLIKNYPESINKNHLTPEQIRYCYLRSVFSTTIPVGNKAQKAFDYFTRQIKQYWPRLDNNLQALSAITLNRTGWSNQAEAIIRALNEKSLLNKENGMYWRSNRRFNSTGSAISTEVNIMKAFAEVMQDTRSVEKMKTWLLMQKQANRWPGTKATADAVYALLMNGNQWINETKQVTITLGNGKQLTNVALPREAGDGYVKKIWPGDKISPALGKITVNNPNKSMAYGAAYWQYFENLNKVSRQSSDVSIEKTLFREVITPKGEEWVAISEKEPLKTGDRVMVRLFIRCNRSTDFVHIQDMRAAALEPEKLLSGYVRKGGLGYYEEIKDATTDFFIRHLPKGTFVLEYPLLVTQKGAFSTGIARIQSLYLPSFVAHSSGNKIKVR